jgi:uncharacterized protein (DUF305 family)
MVVVAAGVLLPAGGVTEVSARDAVVEYNARELWDRYTLHDYPERGEVRYDATTGVLVGVMRASSEPEALFDMIGHHQDAVDAATAYEPHASTPELAAFAARIIRVQTAEISQMKDWLAAWYPGFVGTGGWQPMFCTPGSVTTDAGFLETMIAHHRAAIDMYSGWAVDGIIDHNELGLFAARIGKAQAGEIVTMTQFEGQL